MDSSESEFGLCAYISPQTDFLHLCNKCYVFQVGILLCQKPAKPDWWKFTVKLSKLEKWAWY